MTSDAIINPHDHFFKATFARREAALDLLFDLSQYSDEEIKGQAILQSSILLLKYIFRDDLLLALRKILELLIEVQHKETGLQYIETVLRYLTAGTEKVTESKLSELLNEVFTEGEELMPTLAEKWMEQGREEGLEKGLEKGREEGREEGRQEGREEGERKATIKALNQIITVRFPVELGQFEKQLTQLDLKSLEDLTEIALTVQNLTEFEEKLTKMLSKPKINSKNNDLTEGDKGKLS